jgi:hypothetical protein
MLEWNHSDYEKLISQLPKEARRKVITEFEKQHRHFWESVNLPLTALYLVAISGSALVSGLGLGGNNGLEGALWGIAGVLPAWPISYLVARRLRTRNMKKFCQFIENNELPK